jgi:shikimate dehydrogenase
VASAIPGQARYLLGLVGAEISTSPSPQAHVPGEPGMRCRYQLTGVTHLGLGPADVAAMLAGAAMSPATGTLNPPAVRHAAAAPAGAMGALRYATGRLIGAGTDSPGPGAAAAGGTGVTMRHVVVLGAAGTPGPAVTHAVARLGAERLTMVDSAPARLQALGAALRSRSLSCFTQAAGPDDLGTILADADGVIQAVPVGTKLPQVPVPAQLLRPEMWVADIIYRPVRARSGRGAHQAPSGHGTQTMRTLGAFRLATGCRADAEATFRYLAALTGTVAGNAPAGTAASQPGQVKRSHASAS